MNQEAIDDFIPWQALQADAMASVRNNHQLEELLDVCKKQCVSAERSNEPYKSHFTILAIENLTRIVETLVRRDQASEVIV